MGGFLVLNNDQFSTGVVDFQNPVNLNGSLTTIGTGGGSTGNLVVSVGAGPDANGPGTQSNNGAAYAKMSGGISGTGNLTVYGNGYGIQRGSPAGCSCPAAA